jgi:hypothetical protein
MESMKGKEIWRLGLGTYSVVELLPDINWKRREK